MYTDTKKTDKPISEDQMPAYTEAVKSGMYAKRSGLVGKYDNVRRYWEDEMTRHFLRGPLQKLVKHARDEMRRIRILDLGCGSADGYELLTGIRQRDPNLHDVEVDLLTPDVLGLYKGIDFNTDLLDQACTVYEENSKMVFEQGDFTQGLPPGKNEEPYDLYFMSYGTCSHHNNDKTMIRLLADIAKHADSYCLVICDWLGRYSYEWQTLWTNDLSQNQNMDYVVSYIYNEDERETRRDELQHLFLRLMSRDETDAIVREAAGKACVDIRTLRYFDRSVFTGRHMDTGEYNPHAQPLRLGVNSLHEANFRTDLTDLLVDYSPKERFPLLNKHFEQFQICWNELVSYSINLLELYSEEKQQFRADPPVPPAASPPTLISRMKRMKRVIEGVGWLTTGLPRENIIEPQLGYSLRNMMMDLQQGMGCAHGLVGIFEIDKRSGTSVK